MRALALTALFAASAALASPAQAIALGQVDTFSGSAEDWFAGGAMGNFPPVPPQVVADGGPGGAGDGFLLVTSNGSAGPGGRLVAMNATQWAGDYLTAGVTGITMDVRNLGTSDLTLRLYFEDPIPGPPMNEALTSVGVSLAAGTDWTRVLFPITAADLTVLQGSVSTLLSNTTVLRLYHGAAATFPGDQISGLLGVDNITAVRVPVGVVSEPGTPGLLAAALGLLGAGLLRRKIGEKGPQPSA